MFKKIFKTKYNKYKIINIKYLSYENNNKYKIFIY